MASRLALALSAAALLLPGAAQAARPAPPPEFYGVVSQSGLTDDDFPRMAENGVGIMRVQLSWKVVQPEAGECEPTEEVLPLLPEPACDWSRYDRIFGNAAAAGVEPLPYLLNVPDWISEHENEPPIRSQSDREEWTAWLQAVVGRYGPGGTYWANEYPAEHPGAAPLPVRRWQVWNEPSDGTFWHPRPNAAEYGDLVELTSTAIKSVDPAAEVVLAGVFGSPVESNGGIDAKPYLRKLFKSRDLAGSFDSLGLHPYGPTLKRVKGQIKRARKEFRRAGFGDRPLWLTELGWASGGPHPQLSKTPAKQAKLLGKTYTKLARKRFKWKIAGITWFAWQDTEEKNACAFCADVGLVTVDRQAKPALESYRVVALGARRAR